MNAKEKFWVTGSLICLLVLFSGCALFLVSAGAAGGYAISQDTVEGAFDQPLDKVWKASREVILKEGFIRLQDKPHGVMEAEVKKSEVRIDLKQLTEKTVQIHVKARKGYKLIPDIELANELYNQIAKKLK